MIDNREERESLGEPNTCSFSNKISKNMLIVINTCTNYSLALIEESEFNIQGGK